MLRYIPHPIHQAIPIILLLLTAVLTGIFPSWQMTLVFLVVTVICLVTGIAIAGAIKSEKEREYWEEIGYEVEKLEKASPDIWYALGYSRPPQSVKVRVNTTGEPGESDIFAEKTFTLSLSPVEMKIFADGLLTGTKTLAESDWKDTAIGSSKVRDVKEEMLLAGLIERRNPKNNLSGFLLTQKGLMYLYQYASDWVKEDVRLKTVVTSANPTPSGRVPTP